MRNLTNKKCISIIALYFLGYNFIFSYIASILIRFAKGFEDCMMLIVYISILLMFGCIAKKYLYEEFKDFVAKFKKNIIIILKYFFLNYLVIITCSLLISLLFNIDNTANNVLIENTLVILPFSTIFSAVVFAPIVEELVFRKALFEVSSRRSMLVGCIISSVLFGFLHVYESLFSGNYSDLINIITYSATGFVLCNSYIKSKNIFCSISIHMLNNLMGVLLIL